MITGSPEGIQHTICFATSTLNLFDIAPTYVIVSAIVLAYGIVFGIIYMIYYHMRNQKQLVFLYLCILYLSIISKTDGNDLEHESNASKMPTFNEYIKQYDAMILDLGVNIMPNKQLIDEIVKFFKK